MNNGSSPGIAILNAYAEWIRLHFDQGNITHVHIFPTQKNVALCGRMYKDCQWAFENGVLTFTGTLRPWEKINSYNWRLDWRMLNEYHENEAAEYIDPKWETTEYKEHFWSKPKTMKIWKSGEYFLREMHPAQQIIITDNMMIQIDGEKELQEQMKENSK